MFRIVKLVTVYNNPTVEYYLTLTGCWITDVEKACVFKNENLVDETVERLNKKADKHYCNGNTYQITTYIKEKI
jgi:hypothetical protein